MATRTALKCASWKRSKRFSIFAAASSRLSHKPEPESSGESNSTETCCATQDDIEVDRLFIALFSSRGINSVNVAVYEIDQSAL